MRHNRNRRRERGAGREREAYDVWKHEEHMRMIKPDLREQVVDAICELALDDESRTDPKARANVTTQVGLCASVIGMAGESGGLFHENMPLGARQIVQLLGTAARFGAVMHQLAEQNPEVAADIRKACEPLLSPDTYSFEHLDPDKDPNLN